MEGDAAREAARGGGADRGDPAIPQLALPLVTCLCQFIFLPCVEVGQRELLHRKLREAALAEGAPILTQLAPARAVNWLMCGWAKVLQTVRRTHTQTN